MTPEQIAQVFASLGRIEQKVDGQTTWMTKHVADDKEMALSIQKIELKMARQRGFITAVTSIGSVIGAGFSYLVHRWMTGTH